MNVLEVISRLDKDRAYEYPVGKIVLTMYNKHCYKVKSVSKDVTPKSTFYHEKLQRNISYAEFMKEVYAINLKDINLKQPMLEVITGYNRKIDEKTQQLVK